MLLKLVCFAPLASSLFFSLPAKSHECFTITVKERRSLLTGSFEASGAKEGLVTTIRSGDNELFSSKDAHGELSLKTEPGKYSLCFTSQVTKSQVLSFDVRVRSELDWEDLDTDKAATKKQTDKVEDLVRRLLDRVLDVQDQQHHAITREQVYRSTAESTHDRVIWWTVVKFVVLAITSLSQVWYLKSFFETKQIIYFLFCSLRRHQLPLPPAKTGRPRTPVCAINRPGIVHFWERICHEDAHNNLKTLHRAVENAIAKQPEANAELSRNWLSKEQLPPAIESTFRSRRSKCKLEMACGTPKPRRGDMCRHCHQEPDTLDHIVSASTAVSFTND
jgi:hypothetical protein